MGRGRAKAKQTKVARDLKYRAISTDFASLERELRSSRDTDLYSDDIPDQYADVAARYSAASLLDQDDEEIGYDDDDRR